MTRREFSGVLGGFFALPGFSDPSSVVILQAIAGARLPATLTITTNSPEKMERGLWELRSYRGAAPFLANHLTEVFSRAGICPLLLAPEGTDLTYLIPFDDLTARDRAWTAVNADPQWTSARSQFHSYHFGLYGVA